MVLDGADRHDQLVGDLAIGHARRRELRDLGLASCQVRATRGGPQCRRRRPLAAADQLGQVALGGRRPTRRAVASVHLRRGGRTLGGVEVRPERSEGRGGLVESVTVGGVERHGVRHPGSHQRSVDDAHELEQPVDRELGPAQSGQVVQRRRLERRFADRTGRRRGPDELLARDADPARSDGAPGASPVHLWIHDHHLCGWFRLQIGQHGRGETRVAELSRCERQGPETPTAPRVAQLAEHDRRLASELRGGRRPPGEQVCP